MTDTKLLEEKIRSSGYRLEFLAERAGMSRETLRKKMNNRSFFDTVEIAVLRDMLNLSLEEVERIFFASDVHETTTQGVDR